jgi:23S rRNA pseudouridine2605 synthase
MTKSEPPGPSAAAESPRRSGTPPEDPFAPDPTEKLQKVLARQGHGSRRKCEEMILAGRVTVNGKVAELGARIDATADLVAVDGVAVGVQPDAVYYLLNKPKGVLSAAADDRGRQTVVDLVPETPRVFPVGRLDLDTEGLILLTNDGQLAHGLIHPRFGVEKEYMAQVRGAVAPRQIRTLREGVELEDGPTAPAKVAAVQPNLLRIVIHEGRNRQVRRMCEAIGHPVDRLVRVRFGPIADRSLEPGQWRRLDLDEIHALEAAVAANPGRRRSRVRVPRG